MEDATPTALYITEKELSEWINVPVKTLQRWRWQGGGPPYAKFGGNVRYATSDILKYEKQSRHYSTSEKFPQSDIGADED